MEEANAERLKLGKDGPEGEDKIKEISSVNPIADFKKMIGDRNVDRVNEATSQMQRMIERQIYSSLRGDLFNKAIECLKELRKACVEEDEAPKFNRFAYKLRDLYRRGNAETANFFRRVVDEKITLITKHESKLSSLVEQEEANEFLEIDEAEGAQEKAKPAGQGGDDDFLDDI